MVIMGFPLKISLFLMERIDGNGLVDEDTNYVGEDSRFIKLWKTGEVKGWDMKVSVYIKFAAVWEPPDDEIAKRTRTPIASKVCASLLIQSPS